MKNNTRFFKIAFFILVLVLGGFIIIGIAAIKTTRNSNPGARADEKPAVPVVVEPICMEPFVERILVQGSLEAKNKALVPARIPGTLEAFFVDEGDAVIAGKTKLFQTDALKLVKAVEMQKQALGVAECALLEKETLLEQVQADLTKAGTDFHRFEKLLAENAVSRDGFEQMALRYKQAKVALKHINTIIDLTREQKNQARTALDMAEKDLKDSLIYAPISGTVVLRLKEPGEMAGPGEPVLKIEDREILEAVAFLPAHCYGSIQEGKTRINLRVYEHQLENLAVDYKSPTILEKLRTFAVKTIIDDPPGAFIPGAMVEVEILLSRRTGLGVPSTAIRMRDNRPVIFTVNKGKAHMLEVTTGVEDNGRTEIFSKEALEGESVVVQGQFLLDDGTPVALQGKIG